MNFPASRVLAAVWSVVFAGVYVFWATARATTALLGYDIAVALGCLVGLVVALWGRRWMLIVIAVLLLLTGAVGIGQLVLGLVQGADLWSPALWVEPFFVLGGVLFALAAGRRRIRSAGHEHVAVNG